MAYCSNCGKELAVGAKFCSECGSPATGAVNTEQRKTVYDGEIHKCPMCGEVLVSFAQDCPTCGFELRGSVSSSSFRLFVENLDNAVTEADTLSILRNYPVPNTKEDIFEFMILASSNAMGESSKEIFQAWLVKAEQCYQKAKLVLSDEDLSRVESIYRKMSSTAIVEKAKHGMRSIGSLINKYFEIMPNKFVAILVAWIVLANVGSVISLIFSPILGVLYSLQDNPWITLIIVSIISAVVVFLAVKKKNKDEK